MSGCQIIQTERLSEAQRAERALFDVLTRLPPGYFLYRELKVTTEYREQMKGMMELKPDMVVVGEDVGVLAIEVKDWNIKNNTYEWLDQYRVKVTRSNGNVDIIGNPVEQACRYKFALMALMQGVEIYVQCFVAFPLLTRQELLNKFKDLTVLKNPQSRFFLDLDRTIFKDDLDRFKTSPGELLNRLVRTQPGFKQADSDSVLQANKKLIPTTFCIGDSIARQKSREQIRLLSEKQQKWVFDMDERRNYLLDVAGSGKTNILVSRALFLVEKSTPGNIPTILITTYSSNLEANIRRIFKSKLQSSDVDPQVYAKAIQIMGMPKLTKAIIKSVFEDELTQQEAGESDLQYENRLKEWAADILEENSGQFARFDYVLIDEIQDLDDTHLYIITKICRGNKYLFVGDVGQKIYERSHKLEKHGIISKPLALDRSFRMYRTPGFIAELAMKFILRDPYVRNELERNGYANSQYVNTSKTLAVLEKTDNPAQTTVEAVNGLLARDYTEKDILIITSHKFSELIFNQLREKKIQCSVSEKESGNQVVIVDFMSAKGLERPVVIVLGIEDLYCCSVGESIFDNQDTAALKDSLSRRQIYVALTRTTEALYCYYLDELHPFVAELLDINQTLLKRIRKKARNG